MKYTIKDLREGRCALESDGTAEELNMVLQKAFPGSYYSTGARKYYYASRTVKGSWECNLNTNLPSQSVKDFLKEEWTPKVGEWVEVSVNGTHWHERIFLCKHKGKFHCVKRGHEDNFRNSTIYESGYEVDKWTHIRQIKQAEIEITVKVNGKESKLSDIPEDTLLKIRNNS